MAGQNAGWGITKVSLKSHEAKSENENESGDWVEAIVKELC